MLRNYYNALHLCALSRFFLFFQLDRIKTAGELATNSHKVYDLCAVKSERAEQKAVPPTSPSFTRLVFISEFAALSHGWVCLWFKIQSKCLQLYIIRLLEYT